MQVRFMLCGHDHRAYILRAGNTDRSLIPHNYPVVVGSVNNQEKLMGAAIVLNKTEMQVSFTDTERKVAETHEITLR